MLHTAQQKNPEHAVLAKKVHMMSVCALRKAMLARVSLRHNHSQKDRFTDTFDCECTGRYLIFAHTTHLHRHFHLESEMNAHAIDVACTFRAMRLKVQSISAFLLWYKTNLFMCTKSIRLQKSLAGSCLQIGCPVP